MKSNFKQHQKKCHVVINLEDEEESHPFQVTIQQVEKAKPKPSINEELTLPATISCDEDLDCIDKDLPWLHTEPS